MGTHPIFESDFDCLTDNAIFCDHGHCGDIQKAILVTKGGLLEIHGSEKKSWTHLADHLFQSNQPIPYQERYEENTYVTKYGPRLVFYIFSAEGDLREFAA